MHGLRVDRVAASAALVLVMALIGGASNALDSTDTSTVETGTATPAAPTSDPVRARPATSDAVPLPEPANIPPPTIGGTEGQALPKLSAADISIVEKLRDLIMGKQIERIVERKRERDAVVAFYSAREFRPLWIENGMANKRAAAAMAHLTAANVDGLDPTDYPTQEFRAGAGPGALAEAELRLIAAALTYARHAQSGRVHFSRIHSDISYDLAIPEPSAVLKHIANTENVGAALDSYNPPHDGYKALKAQLAALRETANDEEIVRISDGPVLHIGMSDSRVPLLRKRLGAHGDESSIAFDEDVSEAVKRFQATAGIPSDGVVGPRTLQVMNGQHHGREVEIVIANMERWRWMPRDLGKSYSMLNIPDFSMNVVHNGKSVWHTKVVVGKPLTPTPILSDSMKFITVNPTWNVPPTIMNNDYLPALRQDPTVLDRMGIKVVRNRDGSIRMYQAPGEKNALGRLRFNFPNKFLVYQHDTPDKHLFNKTIRAYSNGCMRVQDPLKYAEVLLSLASPDAGYTQDRLRRMYGGGERNIDLPAPIPVHLTYQTAFVDDSGGLVIRDDIYHYDERMLGVLRGGDRRIADIAVPAVHKHAFDPGPSGPRPVGPRRDAHETNDAQSFFGRLFR